jgi:L-threonylcarbamoyladenylate synthase
MLTRTVTLNPECLEAEKYGRIIRTLEEDGVMVFPTDTFYGLGADCFSVPAIERIYALKGRDRSKPLLVVVSGTDMVAAVAKDISSLFRELAAEFWPGPLTLVLKASPSVPRALLGGGDSLALRLPNLGWLRALIRQAGFPIVATSANVSGEKEVTTAQEALNLFNGRVDLVVDGGRTAGLRASTVLDLTDARPRLVREGAISRASLARFL